MTPMKFKKILAMKPLILLKLLKFLLSHKKVVRTKLLIIQVHKAIKQYRTKLYQNKLKGTSR